MGIFEDIAGRILVLDGAMGTMLQQGLSEEETLRAYIDAGADIITTNSFNANRISLADEGKAGKAAELAYESARRARLVADTADRRVYVAGSVGPTGKSLTLASDASDHTLRKTQNLVAGTKQPLLKVPYDKDTLGNTVGYSAISVCALTDPALALHFVRALEPEAQDAELTALLLERQSELNRYNAPLLDEL